MGVCTMWRWVRKEVWLSQLQGRQIPLHLPSPKFMSRSLVILFILALDWSLFYVGGCYGGEQGAWIRAVRTTVCSSRCLAWWQNLYLHCIQHMAVYIITIAYFGRLHWSNTHFNAWMNGYNRLNAQPCDAHNIEYNFLFDDHPFPDAGHQISHS